MARDGYCGTCYSQAEKAGRPVRTTDLYAYPLCQLCENRMRGGLVHYRPSNGTEFYDYFMGRCGDCRHFTGDTDDVKKRACTWGVLDRLLNGMALPDDHDAFWFDPADLAPGCPATCRRFTDKDDRDGHLRDPPTPDTRGQMVFGDVDIPAELTLTAEGVHHGE